MGKKSTKFVFFTSIRSATLSTSELCIFALYVVHKQNQTEEQACKASHQHAANRKVPTSSKT